MKQNTKLPLPKPTVDTSAYWEAANDHRLIIQHCSSCGKPQFYPRGFCVSCLSDDIGWIQSKGCGRIYTYTVCHVPGHPAMADKVPYIMAMIDLDEGVRMLAGIVETDLDKLSIGENVEVVFERRSPDFTIPQFKIVKKR